MTVKMGKVHMKTIQLVGLAASAILLAGCTTAPNKTMPQATPTPTPTPAATTTSESTTYTLADVQKHTTANDCWLVIDGGVYDVTKFVPQHPGGEKILKGCGTDASALFRSVAKHEGPAQNLLPTFKIGDLK